MLSGIVSLVHDTETLMKKYPGVISVRVDSFNRPTIHVTRGLWCSLYNSKALKLNAVTVLDTDTVHVEALHMVWTCNVVAVFCRKDMERYLKIKSGSMEIEKLFSEYLEAKGVRLT